MTTPWPRVSRAREECAEGGPQTGRDFQVKGKILERNQRGNACDHHLRKKSNVTTVAMIPEMECEPTVERIHPRTNRGHCFRSVRTIGKGRAATPDLLCRCMWRPGAGKSGRSTKRVGESGGACTVQDDNTVGVKTQPSKYCISCKGITQTTHITWA